MASTLELSKAAPFLIRQNYEAYTAEQHFVWAELVRRRMPQIKQHAAREYLEGFEFLCLPCDRLPNLAALSAKLQPRTGWNATPVSGFMPGPAFSRNVGRTPLPHHHLAA